MAESTEIPEAKDPFEKQVAITIAVIAVILSLIAAFGEHANTNSILKTIQASDMWSYYQSKSIKEHLLTSENNTLKFLQNEKTDQTKFNSMIQKNKEEQEKYQKEIKEIKEKAGDLTAESKHESLIHLRCGLGALIMQISIVLCSVAILSRWKHFWFGGIALSIIGMCVGLSAFLI